MGDDDMSILKITSATLLAFSVPLFSLLQAMAGSGDTSWMLKATLDWPFDPKTGLIKGFGMKQMIAIRDGVRGHLYEESKPK